MKFYIGNILKDYRKSNNISQQQLADMLFMKLESIKKLEGNKGQPNVETLFKLMKYLDLDVIKLFMDRENTTQFTKGGI